MIKTTLKEALLATIAATWFVFGCYLLADWIGGY
jgi:hypothetical protein